MCSHRLAHAGLRVVEQAHAGADHFVEVVRGHVGGHADRDAGGAVEQQVRQARRAARKGSSSVPSKFGFQSTVPWPSSPSSTSAIGVSLDSV
jgi:hypothetical protein